VVNALMRADPDHARRLRALFERGEPCAFEVRRAQAPAPSRSRAGRPAPWPGCAWRPGTDDRPALGGALRRLPRRPAEPAWIAGADGAPSVGNAAWLKAVDAVDLGRRPGRGLSFDRAADELASEAANLGQRRETLRWVSAAGRRRAFRFVAQPLEGGGVGVWTASTSPRSRSCARPSSARRGPRRDPEPHRRGGGDLQPRPSVLLFHNAAFAELWDLEPAWLAERPTHGEVLDRLRQRRRLPETIDYAKWKAAELGRYETLGPQADDMWTLPDGRTLKVVRQTHPLGGLLLLFSDITGELKLKAQYNALIQVQQATLDKLNDAVAVFGSDGRLRLHNEAFERFWNIEPASLEGAVDFEAVVEMCVPKLHDLSFWRELKGRVADPDPQARAPLTGEERTSDGRIVVYQSRPLPDGATLIGFTDVTDTRELESALADRSQALTEAERLKRDFVGNVSYELRTPLTTIIGYSELLERAGETCRSAAAAMSARCARPPPSWPARSTTCSTWPPSTPTNWPWRARRSASRTCWPRPRSAGRAKPRPGASP
jgi:PAS domain-containing protein